MKYREWLRKIDEHWKAEYKLGVFEMFPGLDLRKEYRAGRGVEETAAMLTKWLVVWR